MRVSDDRRFNLSFREAVTQDRNNCLFNLSLMHGAMSAFTNYSPGFDLWQSGLFHLLNPGSKWTGSAFSCAAAPKCHWGLCAAVSATMRCAFPRIEGQLYPILNTEWINQSVGITEVDTHMAGGIVSVFILCGLSALYKMFRYFIEVLCAGGCFLNCIHADAVDKIHQNIVEFFFEQD